MVNKDKKENEEKIDESDEESEKAKSVPREIREENLDESHIDSERLILKSGETQERIQRDDLEERVADVQTESTSEKEEVPYQSNQEFYQQMAELYHEVNQTREKKIEVGRELIPVMRNTQQAENNFRGNIGRATELQRGQGSSDNPTGELIQYDPNKKSEKTGAPTVRDLIKYEAGN